MAGFVYFRSGDTRSVDLDAVRSWGLGYAFNQVECRQTNDKSPSGKPGLAFADPERIKPRATGVDMSAQTWRRLTFNPNGPELFVGYWNDAKPTPADLARPNMLHGDSVLLADDHRWQIPKVRRFDEAIPGFSCALPSYWDLDDKGNPKAGAVLAAYRHLWDATAPYASRKFEAEIEDDAVPPTDAELLRCVAELLKANYVVDLPELVLIQALSSEENTALVPLSAVDFFELWKWTASQKKTESPPTADGSITSDGEMGAL